jgi:hypothetical protein
MIDWKEVPGFLALLFIGMVTLSIAVGVGSGLAMRIIDWISGRGCDAYEDEDSKGGK